jgi:hypothetical protein
MPNTLYKCLCGATTSYDAERDMLRWARPNGTNCYAPNRKIVQEKSTLKLPCPDCAPGWWIYHTEADVMNNDAAQSHFPSFDQFAKFVLPFVAQRLQALRGATEGADLGSRYQSEVRAHLLFLRDIISLCQQREQDLLELRGRVNTLERRFGRHTKSLLGGEDIE